MSVKFLSNLDLNKNELEDSVIQKLATEPTEASEGQMYYNTTEKQLYFYDGEEWVSTADGGDVLSLKDSSIICNLPTDL